MSTSYEDAIRMAVSLGADADTLGAIVGSIAESIWGIPYVLSDKITDFLPKDMQKVLHDFHHARPCSDKPLIDTTFGHMCFTEAGWDVLGNEERQSLQNIVLQEKKDKRRMMFERAKARTTW